MKPDVIIAVLAMAFFASTAAFFVMWSKMEEWKQKAKDAQADSLASLCIGNTNAEYAQRLEQELVQYKLREKCQAESVLWYSKECEKLAAERDALQDYKSSTLCPRNDHIWIGGRCKRCGRESPLPDLYVITDYGASGDPGPRGVED